MASERRSVLDYCLYDGACPMDRLIPTTISAFATRQRGAQRPRKVRQLAPSAVVTSVGPRAERRHSYWALAEGEQHQQASEEQIVIGEGPPNATVVKNGRTNLDPMLSWVVGTNKEGAVAKPRWAGKSKLSLPTDANQGGARRRPLVWPPAAPGRWGRRAAAVSCPPRGLVTQLGSAQSWS